MEKQARKLEKNFGDPFLGQGPVVGSKRKARKKILELREIRVLSVGFSTLSINQELQRFWDHFGQGGRL